MARALLVALVAFNAPIDDALPIWREWVDLAGSRWERRLELEDELRRTGM
jgi:hypothetical protein